MELAYLNENEKQVVELLNSIGQEHITTQVNKFSNEERLQFVEQVNHLNKNYPGGLDGYVKSARKLLIDSAQGVNPYDGFTPSVPVGETIDFINGNIDKIMEIEAIGAQELPSCAFVLVAGGLGERLGYKGIKIGIPMDLVTEQCFMDYYAKFILAIQKKGNSKVPLAIMTSGDTYDLTVKLLSENKNFGLEEDQLTIMKQEKVPSLIDNDGRFNLVTGKLEIETKPHGHGDVHTLLYQHNLTQKWMEQGKKWVIFFQDTNALCFRALPSLLGVSKSKNLEVNSLAIPRRPGEAVGAICNLKHNDGRSLTINVEYNQMEPLLNATIGKEETDSIGNSVFPGNTNILVFGLPEFHEVLKQTQGAISEFINPKYADATKTKFKSATRLECMMQDYPKLLKNGDRVGFTQVSRELCFSPMKNDLTTGLAKQKGGLPMEIAATCEHDFYFANYFLLSKVGGAQIPDATQEITLRNGLKVKFPPKIVLQPEFGITCHEIKQNVQSGKDWKVQWDKAQKNMVVLTEAEEQNGEEYLKIRGYKLSN